MTEAHLTASLPGNRLMELYAEGAFWRVAIVQLDGKDRRQVGGVSLTAREFPLYLATLAAMGAYVKQAA